MFESLTLLSLGEGGWGMALLEGAVVTIALALACVPIGIPLGLLLATAANADNRLPRALATVFSTVFRGLPELLTLLIVYYGCQIGLQKLMAHWGFTTEISINAFMAAVIALSLVLAAFSSEVWQGAFKTISKGQHEASQVLGLSRRQAFFKVILPQLMRISLPGLSNNWLSLLKDTSLVSTISIVDLMRQTSLAVSSTKQPMLFYLAACLIYLFFSTVSGFFIAKAEAHFSLDRPSRA
ncbi:ABC transporter permease [Pseudomonas sp. NA-150]|uniref:ABC transporter permease n=1 Tax=Pseudomonas sp. NA-150 TaxID=3367525 RepID=UPI0037C9E3F3